MKETLKKILNGVEQNTTIGLFTARYALKRLIEEQNELEKVIKPAKDGEWIQPKRKGYVLKCCDCGLTHRLNFRLIKDRLGKVTLIQFQAFRQVFKQPVKRKER